MTAAEIASSVGVGGIILAADSRDALTGAILRVETYVQKSKKTIISAGDRQAAVLVADIDDEERALRDGDQPQHEPDWVADRDAVPALLPDQVFQQPRDALSLRHLLPPYLQVMRDPVTISSTIARARSNLIGEIVSGSRRNYYRMMAAVAVRGTTYPVVLPKLRDPRLHLAATITSLQVLGQVAFDFRLSISQILVCLVTCAVIEVTIVMRKQHVLMWPASALLTGNGVAFVLRVPGTVHGDWWSMNGWWIFAGTAAGALLSKYVIAWRGQHVFNPSNIGLVVCFLAPRPDACRAARLLVGADVVVDGSRARDHHHGRLRDPLASAPAADRARVLGVVRRGDRGARARPATR